jgi:hypothetical protein
VVLEMAWSDFEDDEDLDGLEDFDDEEPEFYYWYLYSNR